MSNTQPVLPPSAEKRSYVRRMFTAIAPRYDLMNRLMTFGRDRVWRRTVVRLAALPRGGRLLDVATGTGDIAYEALRADPTVRPVGIDLTREMMVYGRGKDPHALSAHDPTHREGRLEGAGGVTVQPMPKCKHPERNGAFLRSAVEGCEPPRMAASFDSGPQNPRASAQDASRVQPERLRGGFAFTEGDALALPFGDNLFDAACSGFMMRNVTDIRLAFAEQARVVRPGGRVVCLEITRPAARVFRALFDLYFFRFVPFAGGLISGRRDAYTYLPHSTLAFPRPPALAQIMAAAGLRDVRWQTAMLGTVAVHWGIK